MGGLFGRRGEVAGGRVRGFAGTKSIPDRGFPGLGVEKTKPISRKARAVRWIGTRTSHANDRGKGTFGFQRSADRSGPGLVEKR
jgi:hypothetical protein